MDVNLSRFNKLLVYINSTTIFFTAFILYVLVAFLQDSTYTAYISVHTLNHISYVAVLLLILKIFFLDRPRICDFVINLCILVILGLSFIKTSSISMMMMGLFILGSRNINFKLIVHIYFWVALFTLLTMILASVLGIIVNLKYIRNGALRQSLGINYPTDFAAHIFFLVLAYYYLRFDNLKWYDYLGIFILTLIVQKLTFARLNVIALFISLPVFALAKGAKKRQPFSKFFASFYWVAPSIGAYLTFIGAYFYSPNNHFLIELDRVFSQRLYFSHLAIEKYGFTILGQKVVEHGWGGSAGFNMFNKTGGMFSNNYFFIDSSFLRMVIINGFLLALVVIVVMTVISWNSIKYHEFALAAIILMITVSAVVEQHLLDLSYDPFLLSLLGTIYTNNKSEVKSL